MQNRPLWQLLCGIFVYACLQHYLQNPATFFTLDSLIVTRIWLLWAVGLAAILFLLEKSDRGRAWAHAVVVGDETYHAPQMVGWPWVLAGLIFLICIVFRLEHYRPFFFTQDDNLMQFLPVIVQGCRSLMHGVFPTWNPYQLLGAPTTSTGVYSLTYPITYFCYAVSRFIFHNEYLTIEAYCIFHMVAGYFAFYWAARCYGVRPALAATASLCTVLSGWLLMASAAWFYVAPIYFYVPLLMVGVKKLEDGPGGWKWIGAMAIVIGLFFHAGNVQFWVYGMMFMWIALALLKWSGQLTWQNFLSAASALLLGIALMLPLLVPQFIQTRNASRTMPQDWGQITGALRAFLLPAPWVGANTPGDWTHEGMKTGGLILYSGTTFVLFFCVLLACGLFYKIGAKGFGLNVWAPCAVFSALAAFGRAGIVWPLMLDLPLFSKFRVPGKFLAFFDVFAVLIGALVLERLLRRTRWANPIAFGTSIVTLSLVAAACLMPLATWYIFDIKPYPEARSFIEQMPDARDQRQRIFSLALLRSPSSRFWEGMPHNLPTIYGIPAVLGYDPLVDATPSFLKVKDGLNTHLLQSLQEYGAEYVLLPNDFDHPRLSPDDPLLAVIESASVVDRKQVPGATAASQEVFKDDEIAIYRVPDFKPLAYVESSPSTVLPLELNTQGFKVDVTPAQQGRRVIANFLWYPELRADVDGKPLAITSDVWQRIAIDIPAGAKNVRVRFVPEWGKGFACALLAALGGIGLGFLALRLNPPAARKASP